MQPNKDHHPLITKFPPGLAFKSKENLVNTHNIEFDDIKASLASNSTEKSKRPALKVEFEKSHDNASTIPLVSTYSSSVKSAMFSDAHSMQSTRATLFSNKTFDTNSSTVGIPPASILDLGRNGLTPSVFSLNTNITQGRQSFLARNESINTTNTEQTIQECEV